MRRNGKTNGDLMIEAAFRESNRALWTSRLFNVAAVMAILAIGKYLVS